MQKTRSITPSQMAELAEKVRTDTHATIADQLSVDRSSVTKALSLPSTRRVKLLCRILRLYGIEADPQPRFHVRITEEAPTAEASTPEASVADRR